MTKETAKEILSNNLKDFNLRRHSLATAIVMDALAQRFNEDREKWYITGLLHDIDLELIDNDMEKHALVAADILKEYNLSEDIIHAVKAHNKKVELLTFLDKSLWIADPVNGLIVAATLMMPDKKISSLKLKSLRKKFKTKSFAANVDREQIQYCEKMDLSLDDFLELSLESMSANEQELGF